MAGTAWLFCCEELNSTLDYLFCGEAGQISLADALAMGTCARNVILLGDPQQLAQVSQAVHPPGAGVSVLEHLLGEHTTIPPERGLFIDETRRMHPDVCRFISAAIYEDRLESFADCANQGIEAPGRLTGTGIRYVPVAHEGNTRESPEEAEVIASLIDDLLKGQYFQTNRTSGSPRAQGDHGRRPLQRTGPLPARAPLRRDQGGHRRQVPRPRGGGLLFSRWRPRAGRRSPGTWSSCSAGTG